MRLFVLLVRWLTDRIAPAAPDPDWGPWGHTLTLTVGPSDLKHEWRCYAGESAHCRLDREESDGCLYIERMNESVKPWYALTLDGWDEEFPPMQVEFIDRAGEMHWFNPMVGS